MNDLMRPALYQAWMQIVPCARRGDVRVRRMGRRRTGLRIGRLAGPRAQARRRAGDWFAVLSAGAYAMSMASTYNSRCRPAEVMVSGADAWLIRDRDRPAELFRGEHLLPPG